MNTNIDSITEISHAHKYIYEMNQFVSVLISFQDFYLFFALQYETNGIKQQCMIASRQKVISLVYHKRIAFGLGMMEHLVGPFSKLMVNLIKAFFDWCMFVCGNVLIYFYLLFLLIDIYWMR